VSQSTRVAAAPGVVGAAALPRNPDPHAATAPAAAPGRVADLTASVRRGLAGTPGRMRVVAALAVVVTLAFGLGAGQAFRSASGALERAGANAAQVVRVQDIRTNLVRADAAATNAFLVGGVEPKDQRAVYTQAITQAAQLVAQAARAQPADGTALAALNTDLVTYTSGVEQARANNRQSLPVGAQYLKDASNGLRAPGGALSQLSQLVSANADRVQTEFDAVGRALLWLAVPGVLALVVLGGAMVWLARRTHRYVNLGLTGAAVVVLVGLVAGWLVLGGVSARVEQVRTGSYAAALATAQARIAAYDAKANESLTLIARGSGQAFEDAWKSASDQVTEDSRRATELTGSELPWAAYTKAHDAVHTLDTNGDWDQAVAAATSRSGASPTSPNTTFDAFAGASSTLLTTTAKEAHERLAAPDGWLVLAGAIGLLIGLLAAASSWWGVSQRLEEYR